MNIEKIKNFNQYALAIVICIGGTILIVALLTLVSELFGDLFRSSPRQHTQIISEEAAKKNLEENKRTHLVHFREFDLVDTARQVYVIPVSQTVLKEHEAVDESGFFPKVEKRASSYSRKSYYYNSSHNNMLVYRPKSNKTKRLFDSRVSIRAIFYDEILKEPVVLLSVITKDTDKDGILDESDFRTLFLYTTKDDQFHTIGQDNFTFLNYHILEGRNEVVVRFGVDRNLNGKFEWDEPAVFKHYSLVEKTLTDLVSKELMAELQANLDGK